MTPCAVKDCGQDATQAATRPGQPPRSVCDDHATDAAALGYSVEPLTTPARIALDAATRATILRARAESDELAAFHNARAAGASTRQIAQATGVPRSTILYRTRKDTP